MTKEFYSSGDLMRQLMAYAFAAFEWNLYLDTHPYDTNALAMHRQMANTANELRTRFEQEHGPLTSSASTSTNSWDWINEPWPWEGGGK